MVLCVGLVSAYPVLGSNEQTHRLLKIGRVLEVSWPSLLHREGLFPTVF